MPISFDHMQHLGDTLAKIAFEKAGIIKRGVPVVVAPQPAEALAVFEARAAELEAPLSRYGRGMAPSRGGRMISSSPTGWASASCRSPPFPARIRSPMPAPRSPACPSSRASASTAMPRCAGLARGEWPARLQRLTRGPLAEQLPPGWELWLDGGHNESAGAALADFLGTQRQKDGAQPRPLHLIFGMLNTKDPVAFLKPLAPLTRDLQAVQIAGHASLAAEEAASAAQGHRHRGRDRGQRRCRLGAHPGPEPRARPHPHLRLALSGGGGAGGEWVEADRDAVLPIPSCRGLSHLSSRFRLQASPSHRHGRRRPTIHEFASHIASSRTYGGGERMTIGNQRRPSNQRRTNSWMVGLRRP